MSTVHTIPAPRRDHRRDRGAAESVGAEGTASSHEPPQVFAPLADIFECAEALYVVAEMPGIDPDSVEVTFERSVLRLAARNQMSPPAGMSLLHSEYRVGDFERTFTIGVEVDAGRIEASIRDGLLRVMLPKAAPTSHRVAVKVD